MEYEIKGVKILIDKEDFERVDSKNWHFCKGYPRSRDGNNHIYLHQFLLGKKKGLVIDHKNRNVLDNRKTNLRHCSLSQNQQNRTKVENKTSKYMGVCLASGTANRKKKWRALIKSQLIGYFENEKEAALAYNKVATEKYGEFASVNVV